MRRNSFRCLLAHGSVLSPLMIEGFEPVAVLTVQPPVAFQHCPEQQRGVQLGHGVAPFDLVEQRCHQDWRALRRS